MAILKLYKKPAFTAAKTNEVLQKLQQNNSNVIGLETELCYYIELNGNLKDSEKNTLVWILQNSFTPELLGEKEHLKPLSNDLLIEVRYLEVKFIFAFLMCVCRSTTFPSISSLLLYFIFTTNYIVKKSINMFNPTQDMYCSVTNHV